MCAKYEMIKANFYSKYNVATSMSIFVNIAQDVYLPIPLLIVITHHSLHLSHIFAHLEFRSTIQ